MASHHQSLTTPFLSPDHHPPPPPHSVVTIRSSSSSPTPSPFAFLRPSRPLSVPDPSPVDPFRNHSASLLSSPYESLRTLLSLPIALLRLLLFVSSLLLGFAATKLALGGWKDRDSPLPSWRRGIMWVTRLCARLILFSFGYQWIARKGKPATRETAPIVVSNHVSFIDPIFYFYELFPTMVASESHDAMPLVGTIIRAMQVIYVNRFDPSSRKNAINEIKRKASCDSFPRVLLFPEGTTSNGRAIISFQLGAFIPGYCIQPVVVRYPHVHFDQSWGHISLGKLMFRMFTQFHNYMEVEYLPVICPHECHKENPVQLAKRTRHAMASALNIGVTSHSFGDVMLLMKASESKQANPASFMVEMTQLDSFYHISSMEAVQFLDKYLLMKPDTRGRVSFDGFSSVFGLKTCSLSKAIFSFLDVENIGTITYKQYLFGTAYVMKQPLFRETCLQTFHECDDRGDGYISEEQFGNCIRQGVAGITPGEIHSLYCSLDADGDGRVNKESFLSWLRKNPLLIAVFSHCVRYAGVSENGGRMLEEIV
ncbi:hypothetical protein MLD38_024034 [Melastoma candidum]|uniref:Uncharacterized protein n=1 Tax=Melastoma candidum TaxID=119954 RepID=A0ACB9NXS5_9MYRT|nr:hypothetical protein MLD38_024034 [Melastoma candidum]